MSVLLRIYCLLAWPTETPFPRVAGPGNQKHYVAEPDTNWILEYFMPWSTTVSQCVPSGDENHTDSISWSLTMSADWSEEGASRKFSQT